MCTLEDKQASSSQSKWTAICILEKNFIPEEKYILNLQLIFFIYFPENFMFGLFFYYFLVQH